MRADELIARNETLGLVLILVLALVWRRNRSFVRELTHETDHGWLMLTRLTLCAALALIAWTSLFDNWRQLTAMPWRAAQIYPSKRVLIDPPSDEMRAVTFGLLAVALVFTGCLIARHVGGYVLQLLIACGAFVAWLPFFIIRQRFTLNLALGIDGSWTSPADVAAYLSFTVLSWSFDIVLIAVTFAFLAALTAIPVTFVLDVLRLRRPRVTTEAQPFFNAIGSRTAR